MLTPAARATVVAAAAVCSIAAPRHAAAEAPRPVPGTVGLMQKDVELKNACVPSFRSIKKVKRGDEPVLVAALTYARITGLDFDPGKPARMKASQQKFEAWFGNLQKKFAAAQEGQAKLLFADGASSQTKVEAMARMAILSDQAAMLVASGEVPTGLRKVPEAIDVYCDQLDDVAEPLRGQARDARATCAKAIAADAVGAGWWTEVCVVPPDAVTPKP